MVGTQDFFLKKVILCILKGISPLKMHKIIFFPGYLKKVLGFTSKFRLGGVTLNTGIFFLAFSGTAVVALINIEWGFCV